MIVSPAEPTNAETVSLNVTQATTTQASAPQHFCSLFGAVEFAGKRLGEGVKESLRCSLRRALG
jgi:hypothetical protein